MSPACPVDKTPPPASTQLIYVEDNDGPLRASDAVALFTEWEEYRRDLTANTPPPSPAAASSSTGAMDGTPPAWRGTPVARSSSR
jgi:hypothetical protein